MKHPKKIITMYLQTGKVFCRIHPRPQNGKGPNMIIGLILGLCHNSFIAPMAPGIALDIEQVLNTPAILKTSASHTYER